MYPTFAIKDPEEKAKARVELLAGELGKKLSLLQGLVVRAQLWRCVLCGCG